MLLCCLFGLSLQRHIVESHRWIWSWIFNPLFWALLCSTLMTYFVMIFSAADRNLFAFYCRNLNWTMQTSKSNYSFKLLLRLGIVLALTCIDFCFYIVWEGNDSRIFLQWTREDPQEGYKTLVQNQLAYIISHQNSLYSGKIKLGFYILPWIGYDDKGVRTWERPQIMACQTGNFCKIQVRWASLSDNKSKLSSKMTDTMK